jgi:tetratricopeptide (TPR) repeat protein
MAIDPSSPLVHNALANALAAKGEVDAAITEYRTAIRLQPNIPYIHDNLASSLQTKGLQDQAITEYLISIGLNDKTARPHYNLACAYALKGDPDRALQHLGRAVFLNPAYRESAQQDSDFKSLQGDERFFALCGTASAKAP